MSWFEQNPVGVVLGGACGILALAGVGMALLWSQPVATDPDDLQADQADTAFTVAVAEDLGPINQYQVVNDRPMFNEGRRPIIEEVAPEEETEITFEEAPIADAPDVRLTGVVITPEHRFVTLTPANNSEPVTVSEGMPLEGEFVGWSVAEIGDRGVTLQSRDGESMRVDLIVHDQMIKEPPKPEPAPVQQDPAAVAASPAEAGEPMSRADEIRQRIQERREQLRQEAEDSEGEEKQEQADTRNRYQEAIQAMMQRNASKDEDNEAENEEQN